MRLKSLLPVLLVATGSCVDVVKFEGVPIRQYATKVISFSSQFSSPSWSASQALGKENFYPSYGDSKNAWSHLEADKYREFLVLGLDIPQTAKTIEIYETYLPGAIDSVFIRRVDSGKWVKVYSKPANDKLPAQARIFSVFLNETPFLVDAIRLAINSPAIKGYSEIDAVAITGQRKE